MTKRRSGLIRKRKRKVNAQMQDRLHSISDVLRQTERRTEEQPDAGHQTLPSALSHFSNANKIRCADDDGLTFRCPSSSAYCQHPLRNSLKDAFQTDNTENRRVKASRQSDTGSVEKEYNSFTIDDNYPHTINSSPHGTGSSDDDEGVILDTGNSFDELEEFQDDIGTMDCADTHDNADVIGAQDGDLVLGEESSSSLAMSHANQTAALKFLLGRLRQKCSRGMMTGFISVYGQVRYTARQYHHMAMVLKDEDANISIPCHSTIRQSMLPYLIDNMFVRSEILYLGVTKIQKDFQMQQTKREVMVIKPSHWAIMDVACVTTARKIFCCEGSCSCYTDCELGRASTFESCNLVQKTSQVSTRPVSLWVDYNGYPTQAQPGDTIGFHQYETPRRVLDSICRWSMGTSNGLVSIHATLMAVGMVTMSSNDDNTEPNLHLFSDSRDEKVRTVRDILRTFLRGGRGAVSHNELALFPGDHCSFMQCTANISSGNIISVLVSRFWRTTTSTRFNIIVWFKYNRMSRSAKILYWGPSSGIPTLIKRSSPSLGNAARNCQNRGVLSTGMPYYIYRILLYTDDFQPRSLMYRGGSVGGCYMTPIGMCLESRRSTLSVRPISLTPPGVSSNNLLSAIMDDIVFAATNGVESVDYNGKPCLIFVEVAGFVGDYPASTNVLDVLGHTANTPCTHCTFRKYEGDERDSFGAYTHNENIHSGNTSFTRCKHRTKALRLSNISDTDCNLLGMKAGAYDCIGEEGRWPLLQLSELLERVSDHSGNSLNSPVQLEPFDPYIRNVIAPDHLLCGLITDLLEATFFLLGPGATSHQFELAIRLSLRALGIEWHHSLFNRKKKKLFSLKMSTKFSILAVLPYCVHSMGLESTISVFTLIETLHNIGKKLYWWPLLKIDGREEVCRVHGSGREQHHRSMFMLASQYCREINEVCSKDPSLKRILDKPNVHRLLELFIHTIPIYGHALFISELVFESTHQPLKSAISRSTNRNSHMYALKLFLARDWLTRISQNYAIVNERKEDVNEEAWISLFYLFGIRLTPAIDWSEVHIADIRSQIEQFLKDTMSGNVFNRLIEWYGESASEEEGHWSGYRYSGSASDGGNATKRCDDMARQLLSDIVSITGNGIPETFTKACFHRKKCGTSDARYSHHTIKQGDVVQVLVDDTLSSERIIEPSATGEGSRRFFVIISLAGLDEKAIWAAVTPVHMKLDGFSPCKIPGTKVGCHSIICLTPFVRRVTAIHACATDGGCVSKLCEGEVCHSTNTLRGGHFYIIGRQEGYPARNA